MADNFSFETKNTFLKPKDQTLMPVNRSDWQRLRRTAKRIIPRSDIYQIVYGVLFGVFATCTLGILGINESENLKPSVYWFTLATAVSSLAIGVALVYLDKQQRKLIGASIEYLTEELDDIESKFEVNADLN
jgi:hypothetical protein